MPGYWDMVRQQPNVNPGSSFIQSFLAAQANKRQQQQLEMQKAEIAQQQADKKQLRDRQEIVGILQNKASQGDANAFRMLESVDPENSWLRLQREKQPIDEIGKQVINLTGFQPGTNEYKQKYGELYKQTRLDKAKEAKDPLAQVTTDLRKELQSNQVYKDTQTVASAYKKVLSTSDTGAGDMSLIFAYMKMLDPGSTVREGEYATAQNVGSVPQNIATMYNKALKGEKLLPEIRNQFKQESGSLFNAQKERYNSLASEYTRLATELGANPKNVVLDLGIDTKPQNIIKDMKLPDGWTVIE